MATGIGYHRKSCNIDLLNQSNSYGLHTCPKRTFPFKINILSFYQPYLRWLKHLSERLGYQNTRSIWTMAFEDYDDRLLLGILSPEWHKVTCDGVDQVEDNLNQLLSEFFPITNPSLSSADARIIIEDTPPISQIKQLFSFETVEKEITAYDGLHLRFDGLACLAESIIEMYGKQGELIVYDLMIEGRLAAGKEGRGSVEEFIEHFTAKPVRPDLFSAGLEIEIISQSQREAVVFVRECEWARYFQERHPLVGYLMACSTDEVAYKAFNPSLRMQRTATLMEGGKNVISGFSQLNIETLLIEIAPGSKLISINDLPGSYSNFTHLIKAKKEDDSIFQIFVRRYAILRTVYQICS
jgi:hypothetical protein